MACHRSILTAALLVPAALAGCGAERPMESTQPSEPGPIAVPVAASRATPVKAKQNPPTQGFRQPPGITLRSMLDLAETGQWGVLVDRYYGEQEKFRSRRDRDGLVDRLQGEWGQRLTESLRNAGSLEPTIEPDGRAVFQDDGFTVFVLYKHADGRWTFHL